ncbi:MAG TPA: chorismate-binding protein, partial [Planctomycetaceae bacterium]|nr:chorismate-binding protein [Planctomycetaceae bacterium]
MTAPIVEELSPPPETCEALRAFADQPGVVLLDSALVREPVGRYSFLAADPFTSVIVQRTPLGTNPFEWIRTKLREFASEPLAGLPPFQGGAAGLFSYELGGAFEKIPRAAVDEFELPDLAVGFYDWVIAWDHREHRAWIISQGWPAQTANERARRATDRLRFVQARLNSSPKSTTSAVKTRPLIAREQLVQQFPAPGLDGLMSNFSQEGYIKAVQRTIEYICAGDLFQANLSQRLLYPARVDPITLAGRLRHENPAPFGGFVSFEDWAVVSASPERFVCVRDREVETRPIKGTRQRRPLPEADLFTRDELRESVKDQAENVMIVDLLRNDLSRACAPGSIRVPQLCAVETYET